MIGRCSTTTANRSLRILQGKYLARNVSGKELQHVTFAVDFHHFSTLPQPPSRHVYYIPRGSRAKKSNSPPSSSPISWDWQALLRPQVSRRPGNERRPQSRTSRYVRRRKAHLHCLGHEGKQNATSISIPERLLKIVPFSSKVLRSRWPARCIPLRPRAPHPKARHQAQNLPQMARLRQKGNSQAPRVHGGAGPRNVVALSSNLC